MTTWRMVGASLAAVQPEFSLTNRHGALSGYPFAIAVGSRYRLQMRLANPTDRAVRYRLRVSDKRGAQLESQVVTASPHGQWMRSIVLPASPPAGRERVDFRLYQHKMVVRHVWVRYRIVP